MERIVNKESKRCNVRILARTHHTPILITPPSPPLPLLPPPYLHLEKTKNSEVEGATPACGREWKPRQKRGRGEGGEREGRVEMGRTDHFGVVMYRQQDFKIGIGQILPKNKLV